VFGLKAGCDRVTVPELCDRGQVGLFDDPRRRAAGQDLGQRRAIERCRRREVRSRRQQERAAIHHVLADVVDIEHRQDAAPLVAVEDDQVELVDRLHEQLPRGEGDQRQFGHRHAVLLVGRPEDGEMHEVDRRVGFQQVAPCALPRMRLPRHQQNAEPVADAVDLHDRGVVAVGQFALRFGHDELDDVLTRMVQRQRQVQGFAHRHVEGARLLPVDGDQDLGPPGQTGRDRALILDPKLQLEFLADDREGRGRLDHQPAVPVAPPPGQKRVDRRGHVGHEPRVMQLAVGDQDGPGDPRARHLGEHPRQFRHQERPGIVRRVTDRGQTHFHAERRDLGLELGQGRLRLVGPIRKRWLALASATTRTMSDRGSRSSVCSDGFRSAVKSTAPAASRIGPAAQAAPDRHHDDHERQRAEPIEDRPGQERVEEDLLCHGYCPNRSRRAGTWTWSDL
jgi:hypothetical protein